MGVVSTYFNRNGLPCPPPSHGLEGRRIEVEGGWATAFDPTDWARADERRRYGTDRLDAATNWTRPEPHRTVEVLAAKEEGDRVRAISSIYSRTGAAPPSPEVGKPDVCLFRGQGGTWWD
jgi:hypothetical protein